MEKGEKSEEAALREAKEETGFEVRSIKFLGLYKIINNKGQLLSKNYYYEGRVVAGKFKPEFPGCLGKWFPVNRLPVDIPHSTRLVIHEAVNHRVNFPFEKERQEETVWQNLHLLFLHPLSAFKFLLKNSHALRI